MKTTTRSSVVGLGFVPKIFWLLLKTLSDIFLPYGAACLLFLFLEGWGSQAVLRRLWATHSNTRHLVQCKGPKMQSCFLCGAWSSGAGACFAYTEIPSLHPGPIVSSLNRAIRQDSFSMVEIPLVAVINDSSRKKLFAIQKTKFRVFKLNQNSSYFPTFSISFLVFQLTNFLKSVSQPLLFCSLPFQL